MLKKVKLKLRKNKEIIDARLIELSKPDISPTTGLLCDVEVDLEKRNEIYRHGLKFDITDGKKTLEECRVFNIDGKYIKFISTKESK